jgi:hypothetical protein
MAQRFYSGLNSNDFSEWTAATAGPPYRIRLLAAAGLGGTAYGLEGGSGGSATHQKLRYNVSITSTKGTHRIACRVDKNTLVLTNGVAHDLFRLTTDASTETKVFELSLIATAGVIYARATVNDDNSADQDVTDTTALPSGDVTIEARLQYASSTSANDGELELYVNGVSVASRSDVDIYTNEVDTFGARVITINDGGWSSGVYYMDEIYYRDDGTQIYPPPSAFSGYDLVLGGGQP